MTHTLTRRTFLTRAGGVGAAVLAGHLLGSPAASGRVAARTALTAAETATLVAWCDTLVPGAAAGGVGDFVNKQLAKPPDDALLMLRYLDWPPPFDAFYKGGLAALEKLSRTVERRPFASLPAARRHALVQRVIAGDRGWSGPPSFLFYLATRGDGVDVVYGTAQGHARIGAPYNPLLRPPAPW